MLFFQMAALTIAAHAQRQRATGAVLRARSRASLTVPQMPLTCSSSLPSEGFVPLASRMAWTSWPAGGGQRQEGAGAGIGSDSPPNHETVHNQWSQHPAHCVASCDRAHKRAAACSLRRASVTLLQRGRCACTMSAQHLPQTNLLLQPLGCSPPVMFWGFPAPAQ